MVAPHITMQTRYTFAERWVAANGHRLEPSVVFDVGAGKAPMRGPVEQAGLRWYGFDLDVSTPSVELWDLSEPCPLRGVKAGLVLLMDVIEHLLNAGLALDHISDVLEVDGYLLLTTPNPRWSKSRLHALMTGFPSCFTQSDLDLNHHVFPVWPHVLSRILESRGFVIEEYCLLRGRMRWPGFRPVLRFPLRFAHVAICRSIERLDATAVSPDYAYVARKKR